VSYEFSFVLGVSVVVPDGLLFWGYVCVIAGCEFFVYEVGDVLDVFRPAVEDHGPACVGACPDDRVRVDAGQMGDEVTQLYDSTEDGREVRVLELKFSSASELHGSLR